MKHKQINLDVGRCIRQQRENAGYSREKFAELIGITPRFLADVERGRVGLSLSNLRRACEILGISSDLLLWGEQQKIQDTAAKITMLLSGLRPDLADIIVSNIRNLVELAEAAQNDTSKFDSK